MSENAPEGSAQTEGETSTTTPATDEGKTGEPEAKQPETDWKAEARKWEQRAKENTAAAKKLAEIDEANKSEATKAAERITALETELADSKAAALRAQAAADADVPLALITASTEDEIKAQVKTLKEWLGDKKPGGNHVPREGRQTNPPKTDDKKAFADFLTGQG